MLVYISSDGSITPSKQFGCLPEYFADDMVEFVMFVSKWAT